MRRWSCGIFCALVALALTGCKPPGPRALLAGKALIERGQYADAVERLKKATSLMNTNAQAWNYLGLAYHQSGNANDAVEAYKKALSLDQNLVEAHYNLGCLWLEQGRPDLAKGDLTAYTLRRDKSPEGWVKLGEAQLALRDLTGAENSLNRARQFDQDNPEALNDLGVVQMQRNRANEAARYFAGALKTKPDYGPAILNLAILSQGQNNKKYALDRYHDYLSLKPRPANWEAVDATARALEQELGGVSSPQPQAVASRPGPATNAAPVSAPRSTPTRTAPPKAEQTPASNPRASEKAPVEVTQVAPEPVIRGASETGNASHQADASNRGTSAPAEHRGFFSRVNPANLFRGSSKSGESSSAHSASTAESVATAPAPEPKPVVYPRYHYRSLKKPAEGDRAAAQKACAEGARAQQAGQLPEAAADYRRAAQLDPAYFDAYYNLGVVSIQGGNVAQALAACEAALAIQPDSHDARFNFALALGRGNFPVDAANEFEKLLAKSPSDANAHYALANLYAQQLHEPAKAREHYEKVLALNPNFPQAAAVHDWLWANPR
ncbi:MAG TPA: tetratricopeptide repeat protein [Candidatus Polarisedimenticolia bacterium]|nr:tetratricopeptide repeat protein [Candidatus Polarisedimenticolia bacterium]